MSSSDKSTGIMNMDNVKTENPLENAPTSVEWIQTLDLGYDEPPAPPVACFGCGKTVAKDGIKLNKCSKCNVASYCSRDCQISDWKGGKHKMACFSYARQLKLKQQPPQQPEDAETNHDTETLEKERKEAQEAIRTDVFTRIRFYACPYAVFRTATLGSGFLFVQSDSTLHDLSPLIPKNAYGQAQMRSILLHFLTLGEFDAELCRDDFELAAVRTKLQEAIDTYDDEKQVVLLCRFRCGHVALGKAVLVPDYGICKSLGQDYYSENAIGAVQLNLDDL
jgi:hypothetical protein